jgi:hypothetical protein
MLLFPGNTKTSNPFRNLPHSGMQSTEKKIS